MLIVLLFNTINAFKTSPWPRNRFIHLYMSLALSQSRVFLKIHSCVRMVGYLCMIRLVSNISSCMHTSAVWRKDYLTYLNSARIAKLIFYTVQKLFLFMLLCVIFKCCCCFQQWQSFICNTNTTLCGGSLGSRVDEERSKLRELM